MFRGESSKKLNILRIGSIVGDMINLFFQFFTQSNYWLNKTVGLIWVQKPDALGCPPPPKLLAIADTSTLFDDLKLT
jgi:hypothetical protein